MHTIFLKRSSNHIRPFFLEWPVVLQAANSELQFPNNIFLQYIE